MRKVRPWLIAALVLALLLSGCGGPAPAATASPSASAAEILIVPPTSAETPSPVPTEEPVPQLRYVFLFIGDGMGDNHIDAAERYLQAAGREKLCFTGFGVQGHVSTANASGAVTDSAAAATAIGTGYKTSNGCLGLDAAGQAVPSVAETLRGMGYAVGVLTTVALDHATPAGFYAHRDTRGDYAGITADLLQSGYPFFAGGALLSGAGADAAAKAGYQMVAAAPEDVTVPSDQKLILTGGETMSDAGLTYAIDGGAREALLKRMLSLGIDRLSPAGTFFFMVEGGRIDTCSHNHDGVGMIFELLDLDAAVRVAYAFYRAHPSETLIVVTADHETGTLSRSDTDAAALTGQTMSCRAFDNAFALVWKQDKPPFSEALPKIMDSFGLNAPTDAETAYLEEAYLDTVGAGLSADDQMAKYGSTAYTPVTVAAENTVLNRAGIAFQTRGHSGADVSVFAVGVGAEAFADLTENTGIHDAILALAAQYPPA